MADEQQKPSEHENDIELKASLKELRFTAGGNWKRYLGPWIGPILLVAVIGFTAFLIIAAIYASKVVFP